MSGPAALERAVQALVEQMARVHADGRYQWVWQCAQLHGVPYNGPTYERELAAVVALLPPEAHPETY